MYFTIVGLKYYIKEWSWLDLKSIVDLKIEKNEVLCYHGGKVIGFVSEAEAKECKKYIKKNKKASFRVVAKRGLNQPISIEIETVA